MRDVPYVMLYAYRFTQTLVSSKFYTPVHGHELESLRLHSSRAVVNNAGRTAA